MNYRDFIPKINRSAADTDDGVVLSSSEHVSGSSMSALARAPIGSEELTELCRSVGYAWFSWIPHSGDFRVHGKYCCESLDDWLSGVCREDYKSVADFFAGGWRDVKGVRSFKYRILPEAKDEGNPICLRQSVTKSADKRLPTISGFLSEFSPDERFTESDWPSFIPDWQKESVPGHLSKFRHVMGARVLALIKRTQKSHGELLALSHAPDYKYSDSTSVAMSALQNFSQDFHEGSLVKIPGDNRSYFIRTLPEGRDGDSFAIVAVFDSPLSEISKHMHLFAALLLEATRRNADLQLRKAAEELLRKSQRLASTGRLATGVAHDFNNLLTIIRGHTSFLEIAAKETGNSKMLESISVIESATDQAVDLSRQLLHHGKSYGRSFENRSLNEIVKKSARLIRRMLEENITLSLDLTDDPGLVRADSGMLNQILMNLVGNARDAMNSGGTIEIATRRVTGEPDHRKGCPPAFIVLSVSDNGPGMPPSVVDKIFDPFFTTKDEAKGTGIGLANVSSIIEQHGGTIDVNSRQGEGTTFSLYFPVIPGISPPVTTGKLANPVDNRIRENSGNDDDISGSRILLVEDENSVRKLVRKLLEMNGCTVVEAVSGKEALEMWPGICDEITLVVSDIIMPDGVSGWDLAKKLHEDSPDLGILLTSGYAENPEEHGLEGDSRVAFLQKPYESRKLRSNLYDLLRDNA